MSKSAIVLMMTSALLLLPAAAARAGFVFQSGTLSASASASSPPVGNSSNPPNVTMSNFGGSHGATATASGTNGTSVASANINVGAGGSGLFISGNTQIDRNATLNISGNSAAAGNVLFNFTGAATYDTSFSFTGSAGGAFVSIKDAANNIVFQQSKNGPSDPLPPPSAFTLTPGSYTLNFSVSGFPVAFTGGSTSWQFQAVPEPATMSLIAVAAFGLLQRRRRQSSLACARD